MGTVERGTVPGNLTPGPSPVERGSREEFMPVLMGLYY